MREHILVVDDQEDVANALVRLLTTLGYSAKAAYDGRQAVEMAADSLPDMIFIDIGMPGFDGYQTVAKIKAHKECAHAILIALTGSNRQEDRQRAYGHGFDLHIGKPMCLETLQELLALLEPSEHTSTAEKTAQLDSALNSKLTPTV